MCFMNSVLQVLMHTQEIRDHYYSLSQRRLLQALQNRNGITGVDNSVEYTFARLLEVSQFSDGASGAEQLAFYDQLIDKFNN